MALVLAQESVVTVVRAVRFSQSIGAVVSCDLHHTPIHTKFILQVGVVYWNHAPFWFGKIFGPAAADFGNHLFSRRITRCRKFW